MYVLIPQQNNTPFKLLQASVELSSPFLMAGLINTVSTTAVDGDKILRSKLLH